MKGFKEFLERVTGWYVNPDGEPLCPDCWQTYLMHFPERFEDGRNYNPLSLSSWMLAQE